MPRLRIICDFHETFCTQYYSSCGTIEIIGIIEHICLLILLVANDFIINLINQQLNSTHLLHFLFAGK